MGAPERAVMHIYSFRDVCMCLHIGKILINCHINNNLKTFLYTITVIKLGPGLTVELEKAGEVYRAGMKASLYIIIFRFCSNSPLGKKLYIRASHISVLRVSIRGKTNENDFLNCFIIKRTSYTR